MHQWPIGQVVKTAASHAVNIGSNPVWVTNDKFDRNVVKITVDNSAIQCYNSIVITSRKAFDITVVQSHPHRVRVDCCEGPPVPIPNTEVKLTCADDT